MINISPPYTELRKFEKKIIPLRPEVLQELFSLYGEKNIFALLKETDTTPYPEGSRYSDEPEHPTDIIMTPISELSKAFTSSTTLENIGFVYLTKGGVKVNMKNTLCNSLGEDFDFWAATGGQDIIPEEISPQITTTTSPSELTSLVTESTDIIKNPVASSSKKEVPLWEQPIVIKIELGDTCQIPMSKEIATIVKNDPHRTIWRKDNNRYYLFSAKKWERFVTSRQTAAGVNKPLHSCIARDCLMKYLYKKSSSIDIQNTSFTVKDENMRKLMKEQKNLTIEIYP